MNDILDEIVEESTELSKTENLDETNTAEELIEAEKEETVEVEPSEKDELESMREELCRLRAELEEKKSSLERLGKEISEFPSFSRTSPSPPCPIRSGRA